MNLKLLRVERSQVIMLNLLIVSIILFQLSLTALGVAFLLIKRNKEVVKLEEKNRELQNALDKSKMSDSNFYG
jgi:Tfp pilus assembly protein PilO